MVGKKEGHGKIQYKVQERERGRERLNLHTDEVIKQGFYNNWKFKVQNSPPCIALATNLKGG